MIATSRPVEPVPLPALALSTSTFVLIGLWVLLATTIRHLQNYPIPAAPAEIVYSSSV